jgi:hypothetical protein
MVEPSETLRFQDQETHKEALVLLRVVPGALALGLSHIEDGDLEVFVPLAEARELLKMLHALLDSLEP